MSIFKIFMGLVLLFSVGLALLVTSRVWAYSLKYHFPENKYTKLFRLFTKEHFLLAYFMFVSGQVVFTIWFLVSL